MAVIEAKGLTKRFTLRTGVFKSKEFTAVDNISLSVKKQEFIGIVGPNGAGKSTLLKLLSGILKPTSGEYRISGRAISFIELGVGFNEELTGRENTYLYGSLLGVGRALIDANIESIRAFSGLNEFFDYKIKTYSTGMKMRLGFSVAALAKPDVLLIDEIIAVGDQEFQEKSFIHIKNLNEKGATVLLVSHDLGRMKELCSRIIFIARGKIIYDGTPVDSIRCYLNYLNLKNKFSEEDIKKGIEDIKAKKLALPNEKKTLLEKLSSGFKKEEQLNLADKESLIKKEIKSKLDYYRQEKQFFQRSIDKNGNMLSVSELKKYAGIVRSIRKILELKYEFHKDIDLQHEIVESLKEEIIVYERISYQNNIHMQSEERTEMKNEYAKDNYKIKGMIKELYCNLDKYIEKKAGAAPKSAGFGSKEAIITGISFHDTDKKTNIFMTGGYFRAEINYYSKIKIHKPMLGIAIHSKDGILITGPNTTHANHKVDHIKGKGKIKFTINSLPLLEGEYDFSASIYDFYGNNPIDHQYKTCVFKVINKLNSEKYGLLHIDHTWDVSTEK